MPFVSYETSRVRCSSELGYCGCLSNIRALEIECKFPVSREHSNEESLYKEGCLPAGLIPYSRLNWEYIPSSHPIQVHTLIHSIMDTNTILEDVTKGANTVSQVEKTLDVASGTLHSTKWC